MSADGERVAYIVGFLALLGLLARWALAAEEQARRQRREEATWQPLDPYYRPKKKRKED